MSNELKKNCNSCRHGGFESDGEYGEYTYFVCEKREDDGYNNLDNNLCKATYRARYKRCFESMIKVVCCICKEEEMVTFEPSDNYECFPCWQQERHNKLKLENEANK